VERASPSGDASATPGPELRGLRNKRALVDDEPLNFEERRRRREENPSTVRCARCGEWIVATATRCPECGVHFQGEAQEFTHPSEQHRASAGRPAWFVALTVLLLVAVAVGLLGLR
jgi:hypothetical protein